MIINHNISAMNTYRQLTINNAFGSKSLEKLSSGFRINRAGDDAAGLAISEKMRGQIRGLNMAAKNAQDGISLIQTAEGALNETHSILQRMRELAVQAASDTNTKEDRAEIQKEINELATEITRIANTTEFNTQNLLGGDFNAKFHIGANEEQHVELKINAMDAKTLKVAGTEAASFAETASVTLGDKGADNGGTGGAAVNFLNGTYKVVEMADYKGEELVATDIDGGDTSAVTHVLVDADGNAVGTSKTGLEFYAIGDVTEGKNGAGDDGTRASVIFTNTPVEVTIDDLDATAKVEIAGSTLEAGTYTIVDVSTNAIYGTNWHVGLADARGNIVALGATALDGTAASSAANATHWVDVNDTGVALLQHSANAGFNISSEIEVTGQGIDVSNQISADKAITIINNAIETVSAERSKLGAMQNRLDHTINNLTTASENLQAAESRIRDVDYAAAA